MWPFSHNAIRPIAAALVIVFANQNVHAQDDEPQQPAARPAVVSPEQMIQALQVARLAADNGMQELSLRAVREALQAGPPAKPGKSLLQNSLAFFGLGQANDSPETAQLNVQIERQLHALHESWSRQSFPPQEVYATLATVVLPEARPDEILSYPRPFDVSASVIVVGQAPTVHDFVPRSVGAILVDWAVRAETTDDLRTRIELRLEQPRAKLAAEVLLGQLALAEGNTDDANKRLAALGELLGSKPQAAMIELIGHVAIAGLNHKQTHRAALPLVEAICRQSIENGLAQRGFLEPTSSLLVKAARAGFAMNDIETGKRLLDAFLEFHKPNNDRYGGGYGVQMRRQQLELVATELIRAKQLGRALEILDEHAATQSGQRGYVISTTYAIQLARQLQSLPVAKRYEVLHDWTLPSADRPELRVITVVLPDQRPPAEFGKLVTDDGTAFRIPGYGPMRDVFSTSAMLIDAAAELDKLQELIGEFDAHAQSGVNKARELKILGLLAVDDGSAARSAINNLTKEMESTLPAFNDSTRAIELERYLIAVRCIEKPSLLLHAERMLRNLVEHSKRIQNGGLRPYLRRALARAILHGKPGADPKLLEGAKLKHWQAVNHPYVASRYDGPVTPLWIAHEGHIQSVANDDHNFMYFKYPLTGSFEVSVDALDDGWAEGEVSYGGLLYDFGGWRSQGYVLGLGDLGRQTRPCNALRRGEFNRESFDVAPDGVTFRINGVPIYTDGGSTVGSPWFALTNHGERNPIYRNFQVTGNPVIPREVALIDDGTMRGWNSKFYEETRPDPFAAKSSLGRAGIEYDWNVLDGEIVGRRADDALTSDVESWLYYGRPLFDGDTVRFQFYYQVGQFEVHPTVGRLAFMLHDKNVGLHWITAGSKEWTGLPPNNEISLPDDQQLVGDSLPLKPDDWNDVSVSLLNNKAVLLLNGVKVVERELAKDDSRLFGFFHFKDRSAARIRDVVLSGDWPVALPKNQSVELAATVTPAVSVANGAALNAIIEERYLANNALEVCRQAAKLSPVERYRLLATWVLPNRTHPEFRLQAATTPTHPAPATADAFPIDRQRAAAALNADGARRVAMGGNLDAPVLELIVTMKGLGQLDDLQRFTEQIAPDSEPAMLDRICLLTLISLAKEDFQSANTALSNLYPQLAQVRNLPDHGRWGPLLAAAEAIKYPPTQQAGIRTLQYLVDQVIHAGAEGNYVWALHVRKWRFLAEEMARFGASDSDLMAPPRIEHWREVEHPRYISRGNGQPTARWSKNQFGAVIHSPGHERDYLYFDIPLRGDFAVECDLSGFPRREGWFGYAGAWIGLDYRLDRYSISPFERHASVIGTIDPPLPGVGDYYRYRLELKDDVYRCYVEGVKIHEQPAPANRDPWMMVYCMRHVNNAGFRNFRITGDPTIPHSIDLTSHADLTGWLPTYYDQSSDEPNADWRKVGPEIIGRQKPEFAGQKAESILYYHRPMLEDGEMEYEFFYAPGQSLVSPAMDRLAFLLDPAGVKGHWLTNRRYERSGLKADNEFDEPDNRRGEAPLPLQPNEWNQLKLQLSGDTVSLALNDQLIYERALEPTNMRTFGLFHYADQTQARIRNVTYRGVWPRELPKSARSLISVDPVVRLNDQRDKLAESFRHNFVDAGLGKDVFRLEGDPQLFKATKAGVLMKMPGKNGWTNNQLRGNVRLEGDFDVTASFEDLKLQTPASPYAAGAYLTVMLANDTRDDVALLRRRYSGGLDMLEVSNSFVQADGKRYYPSRTKPEKAVAGKLRVARREKVMYYLFAEGDSDDFRLVDTWAVSDAPTLTMGVQLMVQTGGAGLQTEVTWKELTIHADKVIKGF